jgi:hypothetical protein
VTFLIIVAKTSRSRSVGRDDTGPRFGAADAARWSGALTPTARRVFARTDKVTGFVRITGLSRPLTPGASRATDDR